MSTAKRPDRHPGEDDTDPHTQVSTMRAPAARHASPAYPLTQILRSAAYANFPDVTF